MKSKVILWVLTVINIILVRIAMRTKTTKDDDVSAMIDDLIKTIKEGV